MKIKDVLFKNLDLTDRVAIWLCLLAFSFWVYLLNYKFFHFGYYDWDLAFFAQGMWNLSHGSGYVSLFDVQLLANHANLIAFFVIPLYKIFPHPLTLVFLKVASYVTAAFVLYLLTKEKLGGTIAVLFLLFYLFYAPNIIGMLYEFDFESLAPAFLMLIFYFYVKDRWLGFMICAGILFLIKENLPLIVLAFSIHGLFTKKDKIRFGVIPGILSLASFFLLVFVFIPRMSGGAIGDGHSYYIGHNYQGLGGSVGGVLSSIIFHPIKIWQYILTSQNINFLVAIFAPFLTLPLFTPGILFLISPILLQHLLSSGVQEHSIRFAYVLTIAPFLFLATIGTLKVFYEKSRKVYNSILILLVFFNIVYFFLNVSEMKQRFMLIQDRDQTQEMVFDRWELVQMVPPDASVVASFSFLAPLSQRKNLYAFHKIYDPSYQNDQYSYVLPSKVQYALIDFNDPWLLYDLKVYPVFTKNRLSNFFIQNKWIVKRRYGKIILFERGK